MMAIGGGIGRFASRKSNLTTGTDVTTVSAETQRPSTANSFASFTVADSRPSSSTGFTSVQEFDGDTFDDHIGGSCETENFSDFDGGGNFDEDPVDSILEDVTEGEADAQAEAVFIIHPSKNIMNEGKDEESMHVESLKTTSPAKVTTSDTNQQHFVAPSTRTNQSDISNLVSVQDINSTNETSSQKIRSKPNNLGHIRSDSTGANSIGCDTISAKSCHPIPSLNRVSTTNGLLPAYAVGFRDRLHRKPSQVQVAPVTQESQVQAAETIVVETPLVPSRFKRRPHDQGVANEGPNLHTSDSPPIQRSTASTPTPFQQMRYITHESPSLQVIQVTPDSLSTNSLKISLNNLIGTSDDCRIDSPMANLVQEHAMDDNMRDIVNTEEDFELLLSHFLSNLQGAEDIWERGDDELLVLNVDMAKSYTTTLRLRGHMLDILDELDQGLALQDEIMSELQEMMMIMPDN